MRKTKLTLCAVFVLTAGLVSCGPSPGDTPEETIRALADERMDAFKRHQERQFEDLRWRIECKEKEKEWWADRGQIQNEIDNLQAKLEFMEANESKMLDEMEYNITNIKSIDDNNKVVTVKVWFYQVQKQGNNPRSFYLEYTPMDRPMHLTKTDDVWKIKND